MITSSNNQQIKEIMQLQKKSKTRWQQRVFVVEGPRMVAETPKELVRKIYMSEAFFRENISADPERSYSGFGREGSQFDGGLSMLDWKRWMAGCAYEIVSDAVFKSVSDTKTPQGILCLVRMPEYTLADLLKSDCPHLLLLESIQDPGNLGTMLRTGEGAGVDGIIMNRTTVDLFNPKVIRATMGSLYRVPFVLVDDLAETAMELKRHGIALYAAHLKGTEPYNAPDYTKGTAFLIGNEGNGLTDAAAALADTYIRIPMEGKVESLNAAIAATLLMYEVHRQRRKI